MSATDRPNGGVGWSDDCGVLIGSMGDVLVLFFVLDFCFSFFLFDVWRDFKFIGMNSSKPGGNRGPEEKEEFEGVGLGLKSSS